MIALSHLREISLHLQKLNDGTGGIRIMIRGCLSLPSWIVTGGRHVRPLLAEVHWLLINLDLGAASDDYVNRWGSLTQKVVLLFIQVVARARIHVEGHISYTLLLADVVHRGTPSPSSLGLRSFRHLYNLNS